MRPGRAQRVVDAEQVDRDRALEDRRIAPNQRQLRGDAGVGDHHVQAPQPLDGPLHRPLDLGAVGDVALEPRRLAALRGNLRQQLGLQPRQRHPRPAGVQPPRRPGPDPARRAGDQHAPALEGYGGGASHVALRAWDLIGPRSLPAEDGLVPVRSTLAQNCAQT